MPESLESTIRRVDEDRWLASRFAPEDRRARLIAVYAVNYEIARTSDTVTQGAIGDIRLAWWREALAEIHAGRPARVHPALQAYARTVSETRTPFYVWDHLIDARGKDLDAVPFATLVELDTYLEATAGGVIRLALSVCGAAMSDAFVNWAAHAWGCTGLLRSEPHWRARGRSFLPPRVTRNQIIERARTAHRELQTLARPSAAAFPAIGYLALVPGYLRAIRAGGSDTSLVVRQLRLIGGSACGRL
jgi:15-cis-phytoene synthase